MQRKTVLTTLVMLVVIGFAAGRQAANPPDPIRQSFERELNHVPSPAAMTRRDSIDTDELYSIVNSAHWTRSGKEATETKGAIERGTDDEKQTDN